METELKTKHSPGPWAPFQVPMPDHDSLAIVNEEQVKLVRQRIDGPVVCLITPVKLATPTDVANARLIAAAPEMLDELERANRIIHVLLNNVPSNLKPSIAEKLLQEGISDEGMTRSNEREAVIKKAKGE
jgi:BarA-like signal transduction histidine kinase